jgi:hypothetical protein
VLLVVVTSDGLNQLGTNVDVTGGWPVDVGEAVLLVVVVVLEEGAWLELVVVVVVVGAKQAT